MSQRILVVDDDQDALTLIGLTLKRQKFEVIKALNGPQALSLLAQELPDLIILDLMMPEMYGFAVLDSLKSKPETANIPVIVATAKELTPEEKDRLKGQIQALMQKGDFLSDEFLEEVRSLIR